ncbi:MAG: hypothetical protein GXY36_10460 [Chloroflexi bacterium]|nr:hypothetical protein [Chloroflexota bacterium]
MSSNLTCPTEKIIDQERPLRRFYFAPLASAAGWSAHGDSLTLPCKRVKVCAWLSMARFKTPLPLYAERTACIDLTYPMCAAALQRRAARSFKAEILEVNARTA